MSVTRFAFSTNAFRRYNLLDAIEALAGLGYEGIEIMADTPHAYPPHLAEKDLGEIRDALQRHGLEVSNINAFMLHAEGDTWHPSWIEQDAELRARRIVHTLRCIDLAAELGAPSISTEPGGPPGGLTRARGLALFREGLLQVRDHARDKGVRVLIEPEPDLLIENSSQFREFFESLDPDAFGLNFDIGHFFCVGEDPVQLVRDLREVTYHYHLEDIAGDRRHHHLMPGEGAVDLKGVLDAIHEIGYRGFVTVELYPYEDRPVQAAETALGRLKELKPG